MMNFTDSKAMKAYISKAAKAEATKKQIKAAVDKAYSAKLAADRSAYVTAKAAMTDVKVGQVICKL